MPLFLKRTRLFAACGEYPENRDVSRGWELYQRSGRAEVTRATLEIDASFIETQKRDALACYKP